MDAIDSLEFTGVCFRISTYLAIETKIFLLRLTFQLARSSFAKLILIEKYFVW